MNNNYNSTSNCSNSRSSSDCSSSNARNNSGRSSTISNNSSGCSSSGSNFVITLKDKHVFTSCSEYKNAEVFFFGKYSTF